MWIERPVDDSRDPWLPLSPPPFLEFSGINWPRAGQPSGFLAYSPERQKSTATSLGPHPDPAPAAAITYVGRARYRCAQETRGPGGIRAAVQNAPHRTAPRNRR